MNTNFIWWKWMVKNWRWLTIAALLLWTQQPRYNLYYRHLVWAAKLNSRTLQPLLNRKAAAAIKMLKQAMPLVCINNITGKVAKTKRWWLEIWLASKLNKGQLKSQCDRWQTGYLALWLHSFLSTALSPTSQFVKEALVVITAPRPAQKRLKKWMPRYRTQTL